MSSASTTPRTITISTTHHGEPYVCLLECRGIIGAIPGDGDHLTMRRQLAVNDTLHQRVLVRGRGARQNPQSRPDLVQQMLLDL